MECKSWAEFDSWEAACRKRIGSLALIKNQRSRRHSHLPISQIRSKSIQQVWCARNLWHAVSGDAVALYAYLGSMQESWSMGAFQDHRLCLPGHSLRAGKLQTLYPSLCFQPSPIFLQQRWAQQIPKSCFDLSQGICACPQRRSCQDKWIQPSQSLCHSPKWWSSNR